MVGWGGEEERVEIGVGGPAWSLSWFKIWVSMEGSGEGCGE